MQILPITTRKRDIDIRTVYGSGISEIFVRIRAALYPLPGDLSVLLAEPIVDDIRGEIRWATHLSGEPTPLRVFSPLEAKSILHKYEQKIMLIGTALESVRSKTPSSVVRPEQFVRMIRGIHLEESLFVVGGELVLTAWTCTEPYSGPVDEVRNSGREKRTGLLKKADSSSRIGDSQEGSRDGDSKNQDHIHDKRGYLVIESLISPRRIFTGLRLNNVFKLTMLLVVLLLLLGMRLVIDSMTGPNPYSARLREYVSVLGMSELQERFVAILEPAENNQYVFKYHSGEEFSRLRSTYNIDNQNELNISLAWRSRVDFDLMVRQPDGQLVSFEPCLLASCGTLDIDANRCLSSQSCKELRDDPLENISWRKNVPPGKYSVYVGLYSTNGMATKPAELHYSVEVLNGKLQITRNGVFSIPDVSCGSGCRIRPQHVLDIDIN